jgi:hypothetical protein
MIPVRYQLAAFSGYKGDQRNPQNFNAIRQMKYGRKP